MLLKDHSPHLEVEWDFLKNSIKYEEISHGSSKKAYWVCKKYNHSWLDTISHRTSGRGCPVCAGKEIVVGFNDFKSMFKSEYPNFISCGDIKDPTKITYRSGKKAMWVCEKEHKWEARIADIFEGHGCPYCTGKSVLKGFNDLKSQNYKLSLELMCDDPELIHYKSHKKKNWICSLGHKWEASVVARNRGNGCPYCANKKILEGFNDLKTINPTLASECFNPTDSKKYSPNSGVKIRWRCVNNHSWVAAINNRSHGSGCPKCVLSSSSKIELRLRDVLSEFFNTSETTDIKLPIQHGKSNFIRVDIILNGNIIVEYDGSYWHKGKESTDISKTIKLLENGFKVIRIRENPLNFLSIHSDNLLQLNCIWSSSDKSLFELANTILKWI